MRSGGRFAALRLHGPRAFHAILLGRLISNVGSATSRFAVIFWTLADGGDPTAYSLVLVAAFLPMGLGALLAGPVADRWDRRRVMIAATVVGSLCPLAAALLYFSGELTTWRLLVVLFADGVANAFMIPAFDASIPQLVRKERLERASGLAQANVALATIVGSALAGVLLAPAGLGFIFVLDFLTFAPTLLALALAVVPSPSAEPGAGKPEAGESEAGEPAPVPAGRGAGLPAALARDFAAGWSHLHERRPLMRLLWLLTVAMLLLPGFGFALCTPLVLAFADERAAGFVLSSFGVGALLGGVLLAAWAGPAKRMNGLLAALAAAGLAAVTVSLREHLTIMMLGVGCLGIGFTFLMGLARVIWQVKVAPAFLGRVLALRQLFGVAAQSLGLLLAAPAAVTLFEPLMAADGALAGSAGLVLGVGPGRGAALMFAAVGLSAMGIALACFLAPNVRRLEDLVPDADGARPGGGARTGEDARPDERA